MKNSARIFALLLVWSALIFPHKTSATLSTCSASVSPASIVRGTDETFTITATNTDTEWEMVWIRIIRPSENFSITGYSTIPGWDVTFSNSELVLTGSTVQPGGETFEIPFTVSVANTDADAAAWTVQASDNDGSDAIACSGSLSTSITGGESAAPLITNVRLSNLSSSTVDMLWTTDKAGTSVVEYGLTSEYGSTKSDTTMSAAHSISLDALQADSTYHYLLKSTDDSGNTATTEDLTFRTAKAGTVTTTTVTVTLQTTPAPTPTPVPDKNPPSFRLTTLLETPFERAPELHGTASDVSGVERVLLSYDNGENWIQPAEFSGSNTQKSFAFVLPDLLDGNYPVLVRAQDGKGNTGTLKAGVLVIDRLKPQTGSLMLAVGNDVLRPLPDGSFVTVAGLMHKISLAAVGGPTGITFRLGDGRVSELAIDADSGVWTGEAVWQKEGRFEVVSQVTDGAGNTKTQILTHILVQPSGYVKDHTENLEGAVLTVYRKDSLGQFRVWDGRPYSQSNPQSTKKQGEYSFYLPAGEYYLSVHALGHRSAITGIFTLDKPAFIRETLMLETSRTIRIGPFTIPIPDLFPQLLKIWPDTGPVMEEMVADPMTGYEFPEFRLTGEDTEWTDLSLRGEETVVLFFNTWSPDAGAMLTRLDAEAGKPGMPSFLAIAVHEPESRIRLFLSRGRYKIPIIADPDGTLVEPLGLTVLPKLFSVSRKGIIEGVLIGENDHNKLMRFILP